MRIVAGTFRGRSLVAPEGMGTRPTADRTREALFNILDSGRLSDGKRLPQGARVLDVFAGTGALGLEALSRGAESAIFMELYGPAVIALETNIKAFDLGARSEILELDALRPPKATGKSTGQHDLLLLDPPYNQGMATPALEGLARQGWVAPDAIAVVELMKKEDFNLPEGFEPLDERIYGKAKLVFLRFSA